MTDSTFFIDDYGQRHPPCDLSQTRIVSLVPSLTATLFALNLQDYLVGRTGFCIHPSPAVKAIAKIGGTKDVNLEKIRKLAPTHLVVNIDENEKPTVERLAEFIPNIIVTHPNQPSDNLALFRLLGGVFQRQAEAEGLCQQWQASYQSLQSLALEPRKVLYCIWQEPWMSVSQDTYISRMLALRGWQSWQPDDNNLRYPSFDMALASQQVEVILLSTEPYRFQEKHVNELAQQVAKPVVLVDGEMLSWYGSHAIAGLDYLAQLELPGHTQFS